MGGYPWLIGNVDHRLARVCYGSGERLFESSVTLRVKPFIIMSIPVTDPKISNGRFDQIGKRG